MRFGILGPLEIAAGSTTLEIQGPKQSALLIFLLLHANQAVSTDRIIEALWGDDLNGKELKTLRVHITNLRQILSAAGDESGLAIVTKPGGYLLQVEPDAIDAHRFAELVSEGHRALAQDVDRAFELLARAQSLWRGEPLQDAAYESFAQGDIQRLEELHLTATEDLIEARLAKGEHVEVTGELEALVGLHPLRERLWHHLMLALYRSGRQTDALEAQRRLADILSQHGLTPGPEVALLEDRILLDDPTLMSSRVMVGPRRRPPAERSRLIGRRDAMEDLRARFDSCRLLTLTGVGGVGKTRLAQGLAWSMVGKGMDMCWVELSSLTDEELIADQIVASAGVSQSSNVDSMDLLVRMLANQPAVIVLDNCEHLVDATADVVDRLLASVPELRFVATSREPLHIPGEVVWRVPSLALPSPDTAIAEVRRNPSVELFVERSRARGAVLGDADLPAVANVCRRLDGIPLAIELAAARTTTLSADEIEERLTDRFDLLERGGRAALARHRTLAAAIDWSYQLLDPEERRLLGRLAVFVGGFDRRAASDVCAFPPLSPEEVELGLEHLVDKSMIQPAGSKGERRFTMTESVQVFAWDRLEDDPRELLHRHRDWALRLAETGGMALVTNEVRWLPRLEAAHEDMRAAHTNSLKWGDAEIAMRLAGSLGSYLLYRRVRESLRWLQAALDAVEASPETIRPATKARGLRAIGPFLCYHDRLEEGRERLAQAAALYSELDDPAGLMWTRYKQSDFPEGGDLGDAADKAEEAVELARSLGDPVGLPFTLSRLASVTLNSLIDEDTTSPHHLDRVLVLCDEAEDHARGLPADAFPAAGIKIVRGSAQVLSGSADGLQSVEEGVIARNKFGTGVACSSAYILASQVASRVGYEDRSVAWLRQGLEAYRNLGLPCTSRVVLTAAAEAVRKKHPSVAGTLLSAATSLKPSAMYGVFTFENEERLFERVRQELEAAGMAPKDDPAEPAEMGYVFDLALSVLPLISPG